MGNWSLNWCDTSMNGRKAGRARAPVPTALRLRKGKLSPECFMFAGLSLPAERCRFLWGMTVRAGHNPSGRGVVPGAGQPGQRSHRGPAGSTPGLRGRQPPRDSPSAGRQYHRGGKQLLGSTAEPSQRRGGKVRRGHLFHRPLDQPPCSILWRHV